MNQFEQKPVNVVNNLTSDSTTDALSAAQGKALNGNKVDNNSVASLQAIELSPASSTAGHGGFIDFHFNGTSEDNTSRIIETAPGNLLINGISITELYRKLLTYSTLSESDNGYVISKLGYLGLLFIDNVSLSLIGTISPWTSVVLHRVSNAHAYPKSTVETVGIIYDGGTAIGNVWVRYATDGNIVISTKSSTITFSNTCLGGHITLPFFAVDSEPIGTSTIL